jgi:hypothetical protein
VGGAAGHSTGRKATLPWVKGTWRHLQGPSQAGKGTLSGAGIDFNCGPGLSGEGEGS